jgi:argininosuccinate lyase
MTDHILTGRISTDPDALLDSAILSPQFDFERREYLPYYVRIERALLAEYQRMGILDAATVEAVSRGLDTVERDGVTPDPAENMSDIWFAIERAVHAEAGTPPLWHVDRSRNDVQACAQLMAARDWLSGTAGSIASIVAAAHRLASGHLHDPMPGYTHLQPAQVVTPAFYLLALADEMIAVLTRLLATWDRMDACPLGGGAMAGQELRWDRDRLARLLGFRAPQPHALVSVASRSWALEVTGDLSAFGVRVSRFVTDLMAWSGERGFLRLPDRLAGISSAMPQKKNYPVLERIRGKSAHLSSIHFDVLLCQRNTAFANSVEVAKEGGSRLLEAHRTAQLVGTLLATVLDNAEFDVARMRTAVESDFLGGFTLANALTLGDGIPWREAQSLVGRYVVTVLRSGLDLSVPQPDLLREIAHERGGHTIADVEKALRGALDADANLGAKVSAGSTGPEQVSALLDEQRGLLTEVCAAWEERRSGSSAAGPPDGSTKEGELLP